MPEVFATLYHNPSIEAASPAVTDLLGRVQLANSASPIKELIRAFVVKDGRVFIHYGIMKHYLTPLLSGAILSFSIAGSAAAGFYEESRIGGVDKIYSWPSAERLLVRVRTGTRLLDLKTTEPVWTTKLKRLLVSMDGAGKYVALEENRKVVLLDGATGEILRTLQPPRKYSNSLKSLAVSPNAQLLAVGTGDYSVHLHQLPGGQAFSTIATKQSMLHVAFAPNNALLAVPDAVSSVSIYDSRTWRRIGQLKWDLRIGGTATHLVFAPDSRRLAAFVRNEVWLWDLSSGRIIQKFAAKVGSAGMIAFAPDGKWLAASGVWPLKPGNMYAAVGIWNSTTGAPVATLTDLDEGNHADGLRFAFSPDGQRIAIAFPHLNRGPAAVIWRWGEKPKGHNDGFTLTVTTHTGSGKASGTDKIKVAVQINGEAAHQAVLDNPDVNDFERRAGNTFANLQFTYPMSKIEKIRLVILDGDDAWELSNIAFQFFQRSRQSRRYFFSVNKWFSSDRRDVRGRAVQQMDFKLAPKPTETLR